MHKSIFQKQLVSRGIMYAHKNSLPVLQYLVSLITNSKLLKSRNTFIFKGGFCKCILWSNILSRHYMTKRVGVFKSFVIMYLPIFGTLK